MSTPTDRIVTEGGDPAASARGRPIVVGLEALLIVLLLPFGFAFTGSLAFHEFQLVATGIAGLLGWIWLIRRPTGVHWLVVAAPLPLLAASVVASIPSQYPTLSWSATWQLAAYIGIFWLFALQASSARGRRDLLGVISIVLILAIGAYLLAVASSWRDWLALGLPLTALPLRPDDGGGLTLIPTWLADVVALASPVVVAVLWRRGARWAAVALAAVATGTIFLTETRSVLLIVAATAAVTAFLALQRRAGRRVLVPVMVCIALAGIGVAAVMLGSSRSLDEGRTSAYASAIERFSDSPAIGTGAATYGVLRMADRVEIIDWLAFPDAHNIVLTTAAESGIVGLAGLIASAVLVVLAVRRTWRGYPDERLVIAGALFGLAVFVTHGMVDVVFGLVGIIILALGVLALAVTGGSPPRNVKAPSQTILRIVLGTSFAAVLVVTVFVVGTEAAFRSTADADLHLLQDPAAALTEAQRATTARPDLVPAWWVQMVAADRLGDTEAALAAARKMVDLEGFGQQWVSLAILATRAGDMDLARTAVAKANAETAKDPLVQLNLISLLDATGDQAGAAAAARLLLLRQPDIEPALASAPPAVAKVVADARQRVAEDLLEAGDPDTAFLIALSAGDGALAMSLLDRLAANGSGDASRWSRLVDAWFGDPVARREIEDDASQHPDIGRLRWAWRLAGQACDDAMAERWARAYRIRTGNDLVTPTRVGTPPTFEVSMLPPFYPTFVWRLDHPRYPYVGGTLTYGQGPAACRPTS